MAKAKQLMRKPRIIILLLFVAIAIIAIRPNPYHSGVAIRNVYKDSAAALAGLESPQPSTLPMSRERVLFIGSTPISSIDDYYSALSGIKPNETLRVKTSRQTYEIVTQPLLETVTLNETEPKTIQEEVLVNKTLVDPVSNEAYTVEVPENISKTVEVAKTVTSVIGTKDIGLTVYDAPKNNLNKGLDLQGGTRVLLKAERELYKDEMETLIENLKQRLNIYGMSDIIVREAIDLSGNQYVLIEIAGATEREVRERIARQGKFEAKIGGETVFIGGQDITYVCRSATCSGIDPRRACGQDESGWHCRFRFSIAITPEAAQLQAYATSGLDVVTENSSSGYLSKKLELYLDDVLVDELNIGEDLKGRPVTNIAISGSGNGTTRQEAMINALENMKQLQTVLITGSLPVKLEIVKADSLSPLMGEKFTKNSIIIGLLALLGVSLIVFARYRKLSISAPMILCMLSEVIIILGVAAFIKWNLDLAAIAGIIIAVGTGVDDLIVLSDGAFDTGESRRSWKERRKDSFFIIIAAYFTTMVAMVPLLFAGAGLLRGFALTTMIGISVGVFITRPAFAAAIEILLRDEGIF